MTFPGDNYQLNYYYYPGSDLFQKVIGINDLQEYAICSAYRPTGEMGKVVYGNSAQTIYDYDPLSNRLTSIQASLGSTILMSRSYSYEPSGDIWKISDGLSGIEYVYSYDSLHRLTSETSTNGAPTFTPGIFDMQYADPNHVHAVSDVAAYGINQPYSYDLNGNMISGPDLSDPENQRTRTITYNSDNMPKEIRYSPNEITALSYDGEIVELSS